MVALNYLLGAFTVMIPFGIVIFTIDWIYGKVINAFTGRPF